LASFAGAGFSDTTSPLHNPINGLDVDANARIQARDAILIINELVTPEGGGGPAEALVAATGPTYFWDTTNDGRVSSRDALVVINYLTTSAVPEPSTIVLAGVGLPMLAAYLWRRRRRAAS
jgi:hypothetical protein